MALGAKKRSILKDDIDVLIQTLANSKVPHWLNQSLVDAISKLTEMPNELISLQLHYQFSRPKEISYEQRISKASRLTRRLYKLLVKEFAAN